VSVDGRNGEYRVLSDVCVTVLEARSCGRKQGLDELGLSKLAEEAEGVAADVFIGMLKVVSDSIAVIQC
jgi:hypothetical protein